MSKLSLIILLLSNPMYASTGTESDRPAAGTDRQGPAIARNATQPAGELAFSPTTLPATAPDSTIQAQQSPNKLNLGIISLGLIVMIFWVLRRLANPRTLLLGDTPGRPNTTNIGHILLVFALYFAMPKIVFVFGGGLSAGPGMILQIVAFSAGIATLIIAALLVAWLTFPLGLSRGFGLSMRHWFYDSGRGVLAYLAIIPVCYGLAWAMECILPEKFQRVHELLVIIRDAPWPWNFTAAFLAIVPGPLAEELFFRGLLQSMFRKYLASAWGAILLTSVVFSLLHVGTPQYIPALFALSIVLGYNYERCGRLWPSILMHVAFNAVNILIFVTN